MWWQTFFIISAIAFLWKLLASVRKLFERWSAIRKLPCPPGAHWLYGHMKQGPFDPGLQWQLDIVKAFPRAYILWQGWFPLVVVVHPDTIKALLSASTGSNKTDIAQQIIEGWLGEGLATANGAKWKRNRRLLTHSFHLDVLRTYMSVYNDCAEVLLGKMDRLASQGQPMRVISELSQCTFDVILRTAFSHGSNCQLNSSRKEGELDILSAYDDLTRTGEERFRSLLLRNSWVFRLTSMYSRYKRALEYLNNFARYLIEQRQKEISQKIESGDPITKPRDFLDTLLLARDADGSGLTLQEILDEVNTFMFAGHDTTSTSMTWLLYCLAKYPEHQTKIRQEVDEILGDRDSDSITSKDINRMAYMSIVIKESMRMNNVALLISRTLTAPYDVDGVSIPAGIDVFVGIHQLHHNPAVWGDDHMEFKPSRFLPENLAKMDPFSFIPFSAGSRNCIGQQFALSEMKVIVARILRRFRLSLVKGEPEPVQNLQLVLKPQHELLLAIEPISTKS